MASKKPKPKPAKKRAKKLMLDAWMDNANGLGPVRSLDVLRAGIKVGFVNEPNEYGMTGLHLAAADGWLEGVGELLRAGADTETRYYRTGETALMTALQNDHMEIVAALVAGGANPDAGNHFGLTPREWAQLSGRPDPFAHVRKKRVQMPEWRIQNAEHLADHHWPHFKIPERAERETLKVRTAVNLYVYGPRRPGKQDTVKVRITARTGRGSKVRYTAAVETPIKETHLPRGTKEVEFGPENVATVYVPRKTR
jgi:hypothetical protein